MTTTGKWQYRRSIGNYAISGCPSSSLSHGHSFLSIDNPEFAVRRWTLFVIVLEIKYFLLDLVILLLPVVGRRGKYSVLDIAVVHFPRFALGRHRFDVTITGNSRENIFYFQAIQVCAKIVVQLQVW